VESAIVEVVFGNMEVKIKLQKYNSKSFLDPEFRFRHHELFRGLSINFENCKLSRISHQRF
jgi:hypothetical protein